MPRISARPPTGVYVPQNQRTINNLPASFTGARYAKSVRLQRWASSTTDTVPIVTSAPGWNSLNDTEFLKQQVKVYTPSSRLRVSIQISFQILQDLSFGVVAADVPVWNDVDNSPYVWNVESWFRDPKTGDEGPLERVYPAADVDSITPGGFEDDTAAAVLVANLKFLYNAFDGYIYPENSFDGLFRMHGTNTHPRIQVVAIVTWEPNVPMSDAEAKALFQECNVEATGIIAPYNTAGLPTPTTFSPDLFWLQLDSTT